MVVKRVPGTLGAPRHEDTSPASASRLSRWLPERTGPGSVVLVGLCVLFTLALRVPFLTWPLMPDEAGLLIIAQHWHEGPFLYGDYFVGRGVLLMLFYTLADALGGALALRLLGCLVAAMLVIAAGWAGHQLRGRSAAGWSALVAAAYSSTYAFSSQVMNERLLAAALVTVSCACTIAAVRRPSSRSRDALAVLAGVASTGAILVVQSYADGAVFAGVLLLVTWRARLLPGIAAVRIAGAGALGMLLPVAALALGVLASWPTASQVWFQMFGFRMRTVEVIGGSLEKPTERLITLTEVAALTGVLVLLWCFACSYRQVKARRDLAPAWAAILAMVAIEGAGMVLGGSWYPDYLLQLVPALVLATALVAPQPTWSGLGMRAGAVLAAVAAVVAMYFGLARPILGTPATEADVGHWLAAGAEKGDSAVVLWGKANVLHEAGMSSPYPYLWSLLTRTLDPDLHLLVGTLRGPEAPTWIVVWYDFDSWGLDQDGALAEVVDDRYIQVGAPCGFDVYLLKTESREPPPTELCGDL